MQTTFVAICALRVKRAFAASRNVIKGSGQKIGPNTNWLFLQVYCRLLITFANRLDPDQA